MYLSFVLIFVFYFLFKLDCFFVVFPPKFSRRKSNGKVIQNYVIDSHRTEITVTSSWYGSFSLRKLRVQNDRVGGANWRPKRNPIFRFTFWQSIILFKLVTRFQCLCSCTRFAPFSSQFSTPVNSKRKRREN